MSAPAYDLVAVGGGLAGLTAAARAAELGGRVLVLEKGAKADYPCNSRVSGGVFHIAYHDVMLPQEELAAIAAKAVGDVADPDLLAMMIADARRALDWLRAQGGRFVRGPRNAWVMAPPRRPVNHLEWEGRGPDVLLRRLTETLTRHGGAVRLGTRARALLMEDGRCVGVAADHAGAREEIRAAAVVIADGGFQCDSDLFRANIGPAFEKVWQRNAGTGCGDGLRMALAAGAATTGLDRFYGHLLSRDAFHNANLWPFPQVDLLAAAGIVVDRAGRRIFDEGLGGIYAANHLATLADPLSATVICDAAIWEGAGREALVPPNPQLETGGATIHRAGSLAALAAAAGIDPEGLAATLAAYNAALADGTGESLAPARTATRRAPTPIDGPQFFAIPIAAGITNTMGGLKTDRDGRVLDLADAPIPGLYAAGAAAGGLEGGPTVGYFGGLSRAGVFGMRAAEHAHAARTGDTSGPADAAPPRIAAPAGPLDRYPLLGVLARHGRGAAVSLGAGTAAVATLAGWGALGWPTLLLAALLGAAVGGLVRLMAELVSLLADVLLPQ